MIVLYKSHICYVYIHFSLDYATILFEGLTITKLNRQGGGSNDHDSVDNNNNNNSN
jgi:hypothetical protein